MITVFATFLALALRPAVCSGPAFLRGKAALLQLHRDPNPRGPEGYPGGVPIQSALPEFSMNGFCKRVDCGQDVCEPACTEQPCCCWSTFGADVHPAYPSPDEVKAEQQCLNPPEGFDYAPEPGTSFDDGYMETLKRTGQTIYPGRRLCCLVRLDSGKRESQRDLSHAVPTTTTTTTVTTEQSNYWEVTPVVTSTLPLLNPGDEYENAQLEEAARAHLAAAHDLTSAVAALNTSATALGKIQATLETDPNLVARRKRVDKMKGAIHDWAWRRWQGLKRLKDVETATPFSTPFLGPAPPPGLTWL